MSRSIVFIRVAVLSCLVGVAGIIWFPVRSFSADTEQHLVVRFLDVGQGDAVHITTPDGYELLVDGGSSATVLRALAKGRSFFDKTIDMVVATHPDTDHVGGLVDVLDRYDVDWILDTEVASDAVAAVRYRDMVGAEGAHHITAEAGQEFQLGASTTVRVLSPHGDTAHWETNTASVVLQVVYGDVEFMLTGDAPQSIENYLAGAVGAGLESEVLKLGHHGSKTSSSETFLGVVQPEYVVVSAGQDNRYGHPHEEVLKRAGEAGALIVSTIDNGTITFQSNGKTVWIKE